MDMDCVWKAEKEEGEQNGSHQVGKEALLARLVQPMDEVSSVAREAAQNLRDERGDHVPTPQRVLVLRRLPRRTCSRVWDIRT
eukprot:2245935-Pleurochrysis_carterae.AAC.1